MEVYVDGGIQRGTDILKCLCLGATAVGLGRSFLYSLVYGQEGVEHMIESKRREMHPLLYK
jgi:L-lactate dehydrogenase (cytochrome)